MIKSIARKEILHILHDPRTLVILFLMPVLQLIMFGYALNMEIQEVNLAVIDYARTPDSREIIRHFKGSRFFSPFYYDGRASGADNLFKTGRADAALVIPADLDRRLQRDTEIPLQVLVDASDANTAILIRNYCSQVIAEYNRSHSPGILLPFEVRPTILFNPNMESAYFFVPGLIAMLLIMISALLTSITITREKETGTMEQILVSPVKAHQIILGKVLPYILLAFLIGAVILSIGVMLFGVPFRGSLPLLVLLTTLYIITALSLGLMISTVARTQQVAMMIALIATLLPTIILSGFIFPIASMPRILQYVSYLIPARYYLLIVRGIILKGSDLWQLIQPVLFLTGISAGLLTVAIRKFSTNLENS